MQFRHPTITTGSITIGDVSARIVDGVVELSEAHGSALGLKPEPIIQAPVAAERVESVAVKAAPIKQAPRRKKAR